MSWPIKMILTGAQGTGKTSVMNKLPQRLKDIGIREVIRNMTKEDSNIQINEHGNEWSQNRFFFEYLYLFAKYPEYISDRGLIDVCGYTKWLAEIGKVSHETYEKQLLVLKDWTLRHQDVVYVYFPICFPVVDDGYRDINEENRKAVDRCIREVIEELPDTGTVVMISDGSVEDRVNEIEMLIKVVTAKSSK